MDYKLPFTGKYNTRIAQQMILSNIPGDHKRCTICGGVKPRATGFYKLGGERVGVQAECRECHKAYSKANAAKYREVMRVNARSRYVRNRERELQRAANYRANNPDAVKLALRSSTRKHAAKIKVRRAEHYAKNALRIREYSAQWSKRNADRAAAHAAMRRATRLCATPKWANRFFMQEAYALARIRTRAFGLPWHVDHIVPLRSKTVCGLHVENNLQVIPGGANLRKSNVSWPDMP